MTAFERVSLAAGAFNALSIVALTITSQRRRRTGGAP